MTLAHFRPGVPPLRSAFSGRRAFLQTNNSNSNSNDDDHGGSMIDEPI